jgi:phage terminase small subunit
MVKNPAWTIRQQAEGSMTTLAKELGLTPRTRQSIDTREEIEFSPILD